MDKIKTDRKQVAQNKYRNSQQTKGLVRFELQVSKEAKDRFDEMVESIADEFDAPWDFRQRKAKARALVFEEMTEGCRHDFLALEQQIVSLKAEVQALSPSFFKTNLSDKTPLPEAISALPDDPEQLKSLLARTYRETQQAKVRATENKRKAQQYQELYETAADYNDQLKEKLNSEGVSID